MREQIEKITVQAGQILMRYFKKPDLKIIRKEDGSPVTEADYASSEFLIEQLEKLGIPVVSEERILPPSDEFFIIDPLDGTQYFIDQTNHFAVLLALISKGQPTLGVAYFPSTNLLFSAELGKGSYFNGEKIKNTQQRKSLISYSSGFHLKPQAAPILKELNIQTIKEQESVLKMCNMARGEVDFYPRFGRTYEWDTAAGQILLEEAGCKVWDVHQLKSLTYGKQDFLNHGFICFREDLEAQVQKVFQDFQWKRNADGSHYKD